MKDEWGGGYGREEGIWRGKGRRYIGGVRRQKRGDMGQRSAERNGMSEERWRDMGEMRGMREKRVERKKERGDKGYARGEGR